MTETNPNAVGAAVGAQGVAGTGTADLAGVAPQPESQPAPTVLRLVMKPVTAEERRINDLVEKRDLYELPQLDLAPYRGIILGMGSDLRFLDRNRAKLEAWVRSGGRLLYSGHPVLPFLEGMPQWRKLHFHGVEDIWLTAMEPHPLWEGLERRDVLLRTGVPGSHSFEALLEIGVGGFYARNYLAALPEGARVITGIGPGRLPVDVSYALGAGEVIVHAGNDLTSFVNQDDSTAGFDQRIYQYLGGAR